MVYPTLPYLYSAADKAGMLAATELRPWSLPVTGHDTEQGPTDWRNCSVASLVVNVEAATLSSFE